MEVFAAFNTWITAQLSAPTFGPITIVALFGGGLLASLLPCVYPLYPITVNILRSRGEGARNAWLHPSAYYAGLSTVYLLLGALAALSGGAFSVFLRLPEVNLAIAVGIALLGLSSLELLFLPIFRPPDLNGAPAGIGGSLLFGAGAGLLSSPCVGPVVVAVLLGITSGAEAISLASVSAAAAKMFAFGLGLGAPFLLLGAFGLKLPRSGPWMRWVQRALGAMVLVFAGVFYFKAMEGFGFTVSVAWRILGIVALITLLAYWLSSAEQAVHDRMKRALLIAGIASLAVAFSMQIVSVSAAGQAAPAAEFVADHVHGNLRWRRDRQQAQAEAQRTGRPVFVDFYADWCTNCKAFEELSVSNSKLNQALASAVLLRIEDTDPVFAEFQQDSRFPELKIGLPFFVVFNPEGELLYKGTDYLAVDAMVAAVR